MVSLGLNKVPVVRYEMETEEAQSKKIKGRRLYLSVRCVSNVKPDGAYVIRFNRRKTSKNNRLYYNVEVLVCEEDLFVQNGGDEQESQKTKL